MSSIPEQVVSAIVAALTNATAAGDRVYRSREMAITKGETPCIAVVPVNEDSSAFTSSVDECTLTVTVEVHTRGDPFDAAADPLLVDIHRLLTKDAGLSGLVVNFRKKSKSWDAHEADETAGFVLTHYEMRYLSPINDLTVTL